VLWLAANLGCEISLADLDGFAGLDGVWNLGHGCEHEQQSYGRENAPVYYAKLNVLKTAKNKSRSYLRLFPLVIAGFTAVQSVQV